MVSIAWLSVFVYCTFTSETIYSNNLSWTSPKGNCMIFISKKINCGNSRLAVTWLEVSEVFHYRIFTWWQMHVHYIYHAFFYISYKKKHTIQLQSNDPPLVHQNTLILEQYCWYTYKTPKESQKIVCTGFSQSIRDVVCFQKNFTSYYGNQPILVNPILNLT